MLPPNDNSPPMNANLINCRYHINDANNNHHHLKNNNLIVTNLMARTRNSFCYEPNYLQKPLTDKRNSWSGPAFQTVQSTTCTTFSHRYAEISHSKSQNDDDCESGRRCFQKSADTNVNLSSPMPLPISIPVPVDLKNQFAYRLSEDSLLSIEDCDESLYDDNGDEVNSNISYETICDIGLTERLIRCHPIWFLPDIQRAGAIHLLQGKEDGTFIVRQSSQPATMALSVRLPTDNGPYIEHYLIKAIEGQLNLETSDNSFQSIPDLISHYCQCCDELPVQLCLPSPLKDARTGQQLSSLALLGQEFWRYSSSKNSSEISGTISSPDSDIVMNLNPMLTTFKTLDSPQGKPVRPNTLNLININSTTKQNINSPNSTKLKTPPIPPPRWTKPQLSTPNNFTVTTTVTFSVTAQTPSVRDHVDVISRSSSFKRLSPEGQYKSSTSSSQNSFKCSPPKTTHSSPMLISSPISITSPLSVLSPDSNSKPCRNSSKRTKSAKKISKHYQECDILESPNMYHCSKPEEKASDYEDIWGPELITFKPNFSPLMSPDLIPNGKIMSLNNNVLSPAGSQCDSVRDYSQTHCGTIQSTSSAQCLLPPEPNHSFGSFYAQPVDAIEKQPFIKRLLKNNHLMSPFQRHSNPPFLYLDSSKDNLHDFSGTTVSSSADNLFIEKSNKFLKSKNRLKPSDSWKVDSDWKFFHKDSNSSLEEDGGDNDDDDDDDNDDGVIVDNHNNSTNDEDDCVSLWINSFPPLPVFTHHLIPDSPRVKTTVHQLITKRFPELNLTQNFIEENPEDVFSRVSAYDNLTNRLSTTYPCSEISDCTEFSEPWSECSQNNNFYYESCGNMSKNFKYSTKLKNLGRQTKNADVYEIVVGTSIRNYTLSLAKDKSTTFAQNIDNFISCTKDSKEINPQIVMRNIRQFMSGMKNYLVKHGEKGFEKEVELERRRLKSNEFLNLDSILESVLHRLVIQPLRDHLQNLFVEQFSKNNSIRQLAQNIQYAKSMTAEELGIKAGLVLPSEKALSAIATSLQKLQLADSPLEKLSDLLSTTAQIFHSVKTAKSSLNGLALGSDDFLPILVWVIVKTNFVAAEIESEYMWGLLNQSVLSGEGGYCLTSLSSAVQVLKNIQNVVDNHFNSSLEGSSVIKVVVPNELQGSILNKTLPIKSNMTTKQICEIIAHEARITNPQDYALYRLMDDEETLLTDIECPQNFKTDKHYMLVYKRIDAKIAWPKQYGL